MSISVNSLPVGKLMYEYNEKGSYLAPPITFLPKDSKQKKMLKMLVSSMINFEAKDRPTINEVLVELRNIGGEGYYQVLFYNRHTQQ